MHRLKQSFKHQVSLSCCRVIKNRALLPNNTAAAPGRETGFWNANDQNPLRTESASTARRFTRVKNAGDCPRKSRSSVNALIVATAPPFCVDVGRIDRKS